MPAPTTSTTSITAIIAGSCQEELVLLLMVLLLLMRMVIFSLKSCCLRKQSSGTNSPLAGANWVLVLKMNQNSLHFLKTTTSTCSPDRKCAWDFLLEEELVSPTRWNFSTAHKIGFWRCSLFFCERWDFLVASTICFFPPRENKRYYHLSASRKSVRQNSWPGWHTFNGWNVSLIDSRDWKFKEKIFCFFSHLGSAEDPPVSTYQFLLVSTTKNRSHNRRRREIKKSSRTTFSWCFLWKKRRKS